MISIAAIEQSTAGRVPTLIEEAQRERVRRIHAEYAGWQPGFGAIAGFHLWNLLHDIPGHPAGSTVVEATLDAHIFG